MRDRFAALVAILPLVPGVVLAQEADADRGRVLFQRQCAACHQLATSRSVAGPTLQGVMGRTAGSVEGFNYSPPLRDSGIVWSRETLDAYLANPTGTVRGTRMAVRVGNDQQRRDIIEFMSSAPGD